jgi:putative hydrolase of the HAD superfamily
LNHPQVDVSAFIEKYVPINQASWKLYQYDKITHEELRYNRQNILSMRLNTFDDHIAVIAQEYIDLLPDNNHLF